MFVASISCWYQQNQMPRRTERWNGSSINHVFGDGFRRIENLFDFSSMLILRCLAILNRYPEESIVWLNRCNWKPQLDLGFWTVNWHHYLGLWSQDMHLEKNES
jgi:hypothetical protein